MKMKLKLLKLTTFMFALGVISVAFVSADGQTVLTQTQRNYTDGEKAKVKGVIIGRDGYNVAVRDQDNAVTNVLIDNETKVEEVKAWWNHKRSPNTLMPGLLCEVEGRGNTQGQLYAKKVKYSKEHLHTAQAINGGIVPVETEVSQLKGQQQKLEGQQAQLQNQQQKLEGQQSEMQLTQQQMSSKIAELQTQQQQTSEELKRTQQETAEVSKRVSELDDYDAKYSATVNFATGKSELTPEGKQALDELASKALTSKGYVIEVAGHADTTGKEAFNQQLSQRRADAVVNYLEEVKRVPMRRVLSPSGMGTSQPVADNATPTGRAQNRRADVKVLVSKGLGQPEQK